MLTAIIDKIMELPQLVAQVQKWQQNGEKVVFTNGCFDLLHKGHVTYLAKAKALGDRLVVAVNSDDSVRRLNKGPERPINSEQDRAFVLSALAALDAVVIFDEDTPLAVIKAIQPAILVKGGDYDANATSASPQYIVGAQEVKENGGIVKTISFEVGYSTTNMIKKFK
jgi:rfaE bifunctional protein nucleotidyltransferase chain/domain